MTCYHVSDEETATLHHSSVLLSDWTLHHFSEILFWLQSGFYLETN